MVSQSPAKASNLISCACSIHAGSEGPVTRDYKAGCRNKCSGRRTEILSSGSFEDVKPKR